MKFAHLEKNTNKLLGWYDDNIYSKIPAPNIEVSDEIWQEAININANCYENGKFIIKDFRTEEEIEIQRLASIKSKAKSLIESEYPIYKQMNNLMSRIVVDIDLMNEYISTIRAISNKAELEGTALEDIEWGIK